MSYRERGRTCNVQDEDVCELELLRRGPLKSWGTPSSEHWIRITVDEITGRRIPGI